MTGGGEGVGRKAYGAGVNWVVSMVTSAFRIYTQRPPAALREAVAEICLLKITQLALRRRSILRGMPRASSGVLRAMGTM